MSRIVKSHGVHLTDTVFKIKETPILHKRPPLEMGEDGQPLEAGQDIYAQGQETGQWQEMPPHPMQEEIVQGAMSEAARILEDAVKEAEASKTEVMARTRYEADKLRKEADEEGRRHGFASAVGEIKDAVQKLEETVAQFEADRAGYEVEFEEKLKWMAAEIASKVLAKKVAEDDTEMLQMVEKAVASVQREAWVRVEVAQEMTNLIDRLVAIFDANTNVEVNGVPAPVGTVRIETPSGVIDASLKTQLENIKAYFKNM